MEAARARCLVDSLHRMGTGLGQHDGKELAFYQTRWSGLDYCSRSTAWRYLHPFHQGTQCPRLPAEGS